MLERQGDLVRRDCAFAENHPGVAAAGEVDDGGGGGSEGGAAVDDEGEFVAELLADASGRGALGQAEESGRGSGDGQGKLAAGLDDDGEGPGPELLGEAVEGGVELAG